MSVAIRTVVTYTGFPAAKKKDIRAGIREALSALGDEWKDTYLPKHFTSQAYYRYPTAYVRRTARYNRSKGHDKPMVKTGALERQVRGGAALRASHRMVQIGMPYPRAVNLWMGGRRKHDFRASLLALSTDELAKLPEVQQARLADYLNRIPARVQSRDGSARFTA